MSEPRTPDPVARFLFWLPIGLIALAVVASVLALPYMPERVPIHWGIDGQPTRTAPPAGAIVLSIVIMAHTWLVVLPGSITLAALASVLAGRRADREAIRRA
jgi:uncharacterized membrane protein